MTDAACDNFQLFILFLMDDEIMSKLHQSCQVILQVMLPQSTPLLSIVWSKEGSVQVVPATKQAGQALHLGVNGE